HCLTLTLRRNRRESWSWLASVFLARFRTTDKIDHMFHFCRPLFDNLIVQFQQIGIVLPAANCSRHQQVHRSADVSNTECGRLNRVSITDCFTFIAGICVTLPGSGEPVPGNGVLHLRPAVESGLLIIGSARPTNWSVTPSRRKEIVRSNPRNEKLWRN